MFKYELSVQIQLNSIGWCMWNFQASLTFDYNS
jgi:hypothetical protein